jgi:glycosyltransferase involved in cell wall biosynthesis
MPTPEAPAESPRCARRVRLLHVITSMNPADGGTVEGVNALVRACAELGVASEVASVDAPAAATWPAPAGCAIHALGPAHTPLRYARRLQPWLRANAARFDAVIVHGLWQYPGLATHRALRGGATPYFVFTHGMLDPWFKRRYPVKHLKKWLYWPWGQYPVLRDAAAVLFTCEQERDAARASFWLYRARECVLGFGTTRPDGNAARQRAAFEQAFPELAGKRFLLFLGRLHVKKGVDLLIDAFARVACPDLSLVIAGPDPTGWKAELQQRIRRAGIEARVLWTGQLGGDLKWGALRAADAFILPSHQENFGVVVAEALACATPVLISNRVDIWREIQSDGAGLVDADTLQGTVTLIENWLRLDAVARARMRERAAACFARRFEMQAVARRLLALVPGTADRVRAPEEATS